MSIKVEREKIPQCGIKSRSYMAHQASLLHISDVFVQSFFFYFYRLLCLKLLRTGSEDPHRHDQEFLSYYLII